MKTRIRQYWKYFPLVMALSYASGARADFTPVLLTPESFNQDMVVERNGPTPLLPGGYTTASVDGGINNNNFTWNEQGYFDDASVGLPPAGSTITTNNHSYTFAPSYTANNAIMLDVSYFTNANFKLNTPASYAALSFLTSGGNGGCQFRWTVQRQNGTSDSGTAASPDWFFVNNNIAWIANGRVDAQNFGLGNYNSQNPRLYSVDVTVPASSSPITNINIQYVSGNASGHSAIMAISGATTTGGSFTPITGTGYNADIVVEASAPKLWTSSSPTVTTATMDGGANNNNNTWFEQGYYTRSNSFGLPAAGTTFAAQAAPDHTFRMPSSYANANNAIFIDPNSPTATMTLATPAAYSALSFLTASGNGSPSIDVTVHYANGESQTSTIISPDWYGGSTVAVTNNGRINVTTGIFDSLNSGNPRLYYVDMALNNTTSPVTSVDLNFTGTSGRSAFFGLAGSGGAVKPLFSSQPQSYIVWPSSNLTFTVNVSGTAPITYQWQKGTNGTFVNIQGATAAQYDLPNVQPSGAADYRLIASNSGGSSTSAVASVTIISPTPSITKPGDSIAAYQPNGGSSPAQEGVANAIDQTTTKYLNAGNGATPLTVPVGFIVTPSIGRTIVTGLRFYAANDAPERDPANYILQGSNDGVTWSLISSNSLAIPDRRNDPNLPLDPLTESMQQVLFPNPLGYSSYRISFTRVKGNSNLMQIGEVEILGTADTSGFPVVTTQPLPLVVQQGGTAQFTVAASGTPAVSYQWQRNVNGTFVPVSDNANLSGSRTATLNLNNLTFTNAGQYRVVVSNSVGTVSSLPVNLTVLSTLQDVTSPADEVTSFGDQSGDFWGASTNALNAIDNTTAAWINGGSGFSAAAGFAPFQGPVGLVITPASGPTVVSGLRIYTASGNPERDPADYTLEGSPDGTNFFTLSSGPLSLPLDRGNDQAGLDPLQAPMQEVLFPNNAAMRTYRLTFNNTRNNSTAAALQVAEIELLGTTASQVSPGLKVTRNASGSLTITSTAAGTLQSATSLNPTNTVWNNVGPINGSTTITPNPNVQSMFYRVIIPQ